MKITIVGTGNAACASAFKLSEYGHDISMLKTSQGVNNENFETIVSSGGIWGIDHTNQMHHSFQKIRNITRDAAIALKDAEVVIVHVQSLYHEAVAKLISPYISDTTKMLLVVPGAMGSLLFRKYIGKDNIIYTEGESTAFDARVAVPGTIEILFQNVRNAIGVLQKDRKDEALSIAHSIYPTYCATRSNIIDSTLHNPNLIVHTIGVIMSASRIESSKGDFWMYKEAFTPTIWNMIHQLDTEKMQVLKVCGAAELPYLEAALWRNCEDLTISPMESFLNYAENGSPKGPSMVNSRYVTEDVPSGLVLMEDIAHTLNINVPVATALINLAGAMLRTDFRMTGRKLSCLGIKYKEDLVKIL